MTKRMMAKRSPWPTLVLCCIGIALPARARAEASAAQKAAAESLFDDALKAMKSARYGEACPKLEESERIDPGIGTLLYLGECYEKTGRTASAWATFREAASAAQAQGESDRARVAAARADRLQPGLSKLTIRVAPEAAQLSSLRVMRDSTPLASASFGVAIPVDPGKYHVSASADGYLSFDAELEVGAGADAKSVEIPALHPAPAPVTTVHHTGSPAGPTADSVITSSSVAQSSGPGPSRSGNGLRTAAYVTGALGVVGLGIGSYFGIKAISNNSDAEKLCPNDPCTEKRGEELTNDAKHAAVASNIAIGVGAALVVAGVVLYLSHEPAHQAAQLELHPLLGRELAGIGLGGNFQ